MEKGEERDSKKELREEKEELEVSKGRVGAPGMLRVEALGRNGGGGGTVNQGSRRRVSWSARGVGDKAILHETETNART